MPLLLFGSLVLFRLLFRVLRGFFSCPLFAFFFFVVVAFFLCHLAALTRSSVLLQPSVAVFFFFSPPPPPFFFFLSFLEKQEQELQATVLGETHPTQEAAHTLASFLSDIYTQGKKPTSACSICSFAFILLFPITSVQSCITSLFFFFSDDDVVCLSEVNKTLSLSL